MKKIVTIICYLLLIQICTSAQMPKVSSGYIFRLDSFPSKYVDSRTIDIWLPQNYSTAKKYAVVYMNDGQMLFDSTTTWNKQEWKVDETLSKNATSLRECIVVGIWNNGKKRFAEYFPENALKYLNSTNDTIGAANRLNGFSCSANNYLKFIVEELKPKVDSMFSTQPKSKHTFIMGSSMGGLISMYALCEYPNIFGGAACLSTHWPILFTNQNNAFPTIIYNYLQANLPKSNRHKIYFDYGTATLDSLYKPHQLKVDELMKQKKYKSNQWITKEFVGADHSEKAWSERLLQPLSFLLSK